MKCNCNTNKFINGHKRRRCTYCSKKICALPRKTCARCQLPAEEERAPDISPPEREQIIAQGETEIEPAIAQCESEPKIEPAIAQCEPENQPDTNVFIVPQADDDMPQPQEQPFFVEELMGDARDIAMLELLTDELPKDPH